MLACARIGAIHSIVFAGFSATALADRVNDAESNVVITSDGGYRGTKSIPLKAIVDDALKNCPTVKNAIVLKPQAPLENQKEYFTPPQVIWYMLNTLLKMYSSIVMAIYTGVQRTLDG